MHEKIQYSYLSNTQSRSVRREIGVMESQITFGVDVVLSTSTLNQYDNMEYNNEHHNVFSNGNISTPNNSSVSTFTPPSVTSTNDE